MIRETATSRGLGRGAASIDRAIVDAVKGSSRALFQAVVVMGAALAGCTRATTQEPSSSSDAPPGVPASTGAVSDGSSSAATSADAAKVADAATRSDAATRADAAATADAAASA
ncbi:MAG: hypothetical protein R3B09_18880, partial [Nannocystaceae bacterium]